MTSADNRQQPFPAVPQFLSAGDHETRDYHTAQDASRPTMNQSPYLTPYLGLRARLSQVWINRWTILLILVLIRTLLAIASINDGLGSARVRALSACTSVESVGSAMASMPHYMSEGVNEIAASGVEKAVNGLMSMLELGITAVENIVIFIFNLLTSTYVCLITLAVAGSMRAALEVIDKVKKFLDDNLKSIGDAIANGVDGFSKDLQKFVDALNSIPFVDQNKAPKINIGGDLGKLRDLKLPPGLDDDIRKLNQSIPTFKDVNEFTNGAIRIPFEELKKLINGTLGEYEFNRSVFPVPQREKLNFCTGNDGINEFFDGLVNLAYTARKIFLAVIIILAILACVPMAYREIRRWRTMQRRAKLISSQAYDPLDVVYISSRPYTSTFGIKVANRFRSPRNQNLIRWAVAYATSTPALFILSLGVAGLFACLCQFILLRAIQKEVPNLENQVGAFADKVVRSLNNASQQWALGVNGAINKTNTDINQNVFGWVNTSTSTVNNTLNVFVDRMSDTLNKTFGNTVLYEPIKEVLNCLVGIKIQGIQDGLTWVSDHAHVQFPGLPVDTFSLGAAKSLSNDSSVDSFLANPGSKSKDEISEAVASIVRKFESGIEQEAIISTCIILIWVIIAAIGIGRALVLLVGRDKTRAEGGGMTYMPDPETANNRATSVQHDFQPTYRPESVAPPYEYPASENKAAPYTLQPRPFPTFEPGSEPSTSANNEKFGNVGAQNAGHAVTQPFHQRASTHAHLAGTSPVDEKDRNLFNNSF